MSAIATRLVSPENAVRFLAHEARLCRDRDAHEALCLLLPALCRLMELPAMDDFEARAFQHEFHELLKER